MLSTDERRIRHLLGRAGFGATPADVLAWRGKPYEEIVDSLLNAPVDADRLAIQEDDKKRAGIGPLQAWWVHRMLATVNPLQERMILFWHNHFTSAVSKVGYASLMERQYALFRTYGLGNFGELAKAVSKDAAMLIWLDGRNNVKKAPNENYARELMELFTIGIGNYTEADVREAARAFTGWRLDKEHQVSFVKSLHDDGLKTVLGTSGDLNGDQVIGVLLSSPKTAEFLAKKMLENFVIPSPPQPMIAKFADKLQQVDYEIKPFLKYLFTSAEFLSDSAYRSLVKSPADYAVQIGKSIPSSVKPAEMANAMRNMSQSLFDPPNVAGWPGGLAWLNAGTWTARFNFAERIVSLCDIEKLFKDASPVDRALQLAGISDASESTRSALQAYASLQNTGNSGKAASQHLRELLHLALVAPEAQMK